MASRLFFILVALFFTVGRAPASENLFGKDKREAVTSTAYPWSTIGYLSTACTGTLVAKDLVLTAAHCVIDPATRRLRTNLTSFQPNYIEGKAERSAGIEHVWWGTTDPDNYRAHDWAILRLSSPEGEKYGWMGVDDNSRVTQVTLAGYSQDFLYGNTASAHRACVIRGRQSGFLLHDCHNTRGASGGPMFAMKGEVAYIFALNVAEYRGGGEASLRIPQYDPLHANIALPAATFLPTLKRLKGD